MSKNDENSHQNENLNKKSPQEQNNQQPPEEQPGFFQKYMWYIIFFIAFQIGSSFFRKNNPLQYSTSTSNPNGLMHHSQNPSMKTSPPGGQPQCRKGGADTEYSDGAIRHIHGQYNHKHT